MLWWELHGGMAPCRGHSAQLLRSCFGAVRHQPMLSCGSAARAAAGALGRAEEGVERVMRRAAVARLGLDLGISAEDSTHRCACKAPSCVRAPAVMQGGTDAPRPGCLHVAGTLAAATVSPLLLQRCWSIRHCWGAVS